MVIVIKKGSGKKEIQNALAKLKPQKKDGFDAKKHAGKVVWKEDPLEYQKKLRNEWD